MNYVPKSTFYFNFFKFNRRVKKKIIKIGSVVFVIHTEQTNGQTDRYCEICIYVPEIILHFIIGTGLFINKYLCFNIQTILFSVVVAAEYK